MKNIAIDLDKTLIDCDSTIYQLSNKYFADIFATSNKKLKYSIIKDEFDDKDGIISKIINKFTRMGNISSYIVQKNAVELINEWYNEGIKIYFLSCRPNFASLNMVLRKFFDESNIHYNSLVVNCNNKAKFCKRFDIDLLIDNSPSVCLDVESNDINAICLNDKLTNKKRFSELSFARDWLEIREVVNSMRFNKNNIKI